MRLNGLDLNLLVALLAILNERNISRAARRVHLSQPAMSNALARLRAYFDDPLIVRAGRGMMLTARAEALHAPLREILERIETTVAAPPAFDPATAVRQFSLVVSDYTAQVLVQPLIRELSRTAPHVRFRLMPQTGPNPADLLEQREADLLIIPEHYLAPAQPSLKLFSERYVCVTWRGSRAQRGTLTLQKYRSAGHVVPRFGDGRMPSFDTWLAESRGLVRREEVVAYNLSSLAELVVGTDRIATMHRRLAERAARQWPLRIVKPPFEIPPLIEYAQWTRARSDDAGLKWLVQRCHDMAQTV